MVIIKSCSKKRNKQREEALIHRKNTASFPYLKYAETYATINPLYKIRDKKVKSTIFEVLESGIERKSKTKTFIRKSGYGV
jgi:hypothetical protein